MAIRAGSGQLKYPVASRAQLQAQQNAASASAGGSASSSAFGANRRFAGLKRSIASQEQQNFLQRQFDAGESALQRQSAQSLQDQRLKSNAELQADRQAFDAEQNVLNQEFTAGQNTLSRGFTAEQNQLSRDFTAGQNLENRNFQRDENRTNRQFTADENDLRYERQIELSERQLYTEISQGLRDGTLVLDPEDMRELKSLESGISEKYMKNLSPEQRQQAMQLVEEGKRRVFRKAKRPPSNEAELNRTTSFYDEITGKFYPDNAPGRKAVNPQYPDLFNQGNKGIPDPDGGGTGSGGGSAETAGDLTSKWKNAGASSGIDPGISSKWVTAGIGPDNAAALSWAKSGKTPEDAKKYTDAKPGETVQFSDGTYGTKPKKK